MNAKDEVILELEYLLNRAVGAVTYGNTGIFERHYRDKVALLEWIVRKVKEEAGRA